MNAYTTRYHRDGTVTLWDVYSQQWRRLSASYLVGQCERAFGNLLLPTLPERDRRRIVRTAQEQAGRLQV